MKILILGGTRFFGIYTVDRLLSEGHDVTIATRGRMTDNYGNAVCRLILERENENSVQAALRGKRFDVVIDKSAYCSNDIKYVMDSIDCDKYIYMSTTSIYQPKHLDTKEEEFDAEKQPLVWCSRGDYPYGIIKGKAECALTQCYKQVDSISARYPFVIGEDDYTNRVRFYVEHVYNGTAMYIDNIDCQMSFIRSDEAGDFIAYLTGVEYNGAVNGASDGTISIREMLNYIENKLGKKAVLLNSGDPAPYNSEPEYSINTNRAKNLGYSFTSLKSWIYDLLDFYIEEVFKQPV